MDEMVPHKIFTIAQANELIGRLTPLLLELQSRRGEIMTLEVEIDSLELIMDKKGEDAPPAVHAKVEDYTRSVNRFYALVESIHETGCLLKDVDQGLVDFYGLKAGQEIFLCWKLGEPAVAHWHEVNRGFTNRQPLEGDK